MIRALQESTGDQQHRSYVSSAQESCSQLLGAGDHPLLDVFSRLLSWRFLPQRQQSASSQRATTTESGTFVGSYRVEADPAQRQGELHVLRHCVQQQVFPPATSMTSLPRE